MPIALQITTAVVAGLALLVSVLALVVATRSMRAARRSAAAAEANVAIATRKEHREVEDRHDQDGPTFAASEVAVVHDRKAQIVVRMVGGPGKVVIDAEPDTPWCAGISSGEDGQLSSSIRFAPMDAGDDIRFTAHLTANPWQGHDQIILALRFSVESRESPPRTWERRVRVPLKPPPPRPEIY
ncbi:hypothetical protein [Pseudonocardia nigra]|uniref:hypothetical protein n=1 Tax=Pseudonocardia nigra TaxID=1921578 RepID=UPI001C5FC79D|nr:hypothetical protein [Pseudonocardia nigra]